MQIATDLTKHQTGYLINLLNKDYQKMRENLEYIKRTNFSEKNKIDMILRTERAMEENETICHKLDDHLTDIGRGYKLNIDEGWKNNG